MGAAGAREGGCRTVVVRLAVDSAFGARVRLELDGRRAVGEPSKKPEDVCVRCAGRKQIKLGKRNGALLLDLSGHGTG